MRSGSLHRYKLQIAYDGTHYHGWQVQRNGHSIQETLQKKALILLKQEVHITGSGRTDSGVHALAQAAHMDLDEKLNLFRFPYALNAILPADIRILSIEEVPADFHARYSAVGKIYTYYIALKDFQDPFTRLYTWYLPYREFSLEALKESAAKLIGTHDFKGFANEAHEGIASYDSQRTMKRVDVEDHGGRIKIEFEADGFLYKMVRNCIGTLVDIGRGRFGTDVIDQVFETKKREEAGTTAPGHGLFLTRVLY